MIELFKFLTDNELTLKAENIDNKLVITLSKGNFCSTFIVRDDISENDLGREYFIPARDAINRASS